MSYYQGLNGQVILRGTGMHTVASLGPNSSVSFSRIVKASTVRFLDRGKLFGK